VKKIIIVLLIPALFLIFAVGCNKEISGYVNYLTYKKQPLNAIERGFVYVSFNSMWVVGYPLFPEAARILRHYLHGDGTDLTVSNSYIKRSTFINKIIRDKGPGTHKIFFRQHKDWRLSYALNPFTIQIKKSGEVKIWQWIHFPTNKGVRVRLNFFGRELKVNDALVHKLKPRAFMARVESWNHKEI